MEGVGVKVCGLTSEEAIVAVAGAGARYAGFVFFPKSPRNLDVSRAGRLTIASSDVNPQTLTPTPSIPAT